MKQTAVEWLELQMDNLLMDGYEFDCSQANELYKQAKEMEKQQKGYSEEDMKQYSDYVLMCSAEKTFKLPLSPKQWLEKFKNK